MHTCLVNGQSRSRSKDKCFWDVSGPHSFTSASVCLFGTRPAVASRKSLNEQEGFYTLLPSLSQLNDEEEEYIPKGKWFPTFEKITLILLVVLGVCGCDLIRKLAHVALILSHYLIYGLC